MSLSYAELAERLVDISQKKSEWAGLPIPIKGHTLKLEPRFPYQFHVREIDETQQGGPDYECINQWYSQRYRCDVAIYRDESGQLRATFVLKNEGTILLDTLFCSIVWPISAEFKAQQKLASMITAHAFTTYVMTGSFLESSKRSGVTYIFRRLRPTIALRADDKGSRILATLCMHPIGYYAGTWAGVMTPTDDVIAHLCMMRGDEHKFWANANQHPAHHPASGL